jgi:NAD-dependent dihydropyrimidine dehydrogenase PreA subunit
MIKSIDHSGCIKCGICAKFCPGHVIVISKEDGLPHIAYGNDCWNCFNCELMCPTEAIHVEPYRKEKPMAW